MTKHACLTNCPRQRRHNRTVAGTESTSQLKCVQALTGSRKFSTSMYCSTLFRFLAVVVTAGLRRAARLKSPEYTDPSSAKQRQKKRRSLAAPVSDGRRKPHESRRSFPQCAA